MSVALSSNREIEYLAWNKLYAHIPIREIAEAARNILNDFRMFRWYNQFDDIGYVILHYKNISFDTESIDEFPSPELLTKLRLLL